MTVNVPNHVTTTTGNACTCVPTSTRNARKENVTNDDSVLAISGYHIRRVFCGRRHTRVLRGVETPVTEPTNTQPTNPYRDGVCWYGLKVKMRDNHQRGNVVPCGLDARKYTVQRKENGSLVMSVWVCLNHKTSLENDGFLLTLQP